MDTDPRYDSKARDRAAKAYKRAGTIRGAAEILGLSVSRTYALLREAGVDTSRKRAA